MKQFAPFLLLLISVFSANAQTDQGNMMVGGTFRVSSSGSEGSDIKTTSLLISPSFGYFVSDNLVVGAGIGLGSSNTSGGGVSAKSSSFSFGPFARYYKFTSNENFAFFGHAGLTFSSAKSATDVKSSGMTLAISPGFAYFFNEKWALEMSLYGISLETYDPNKDNDNDKSTDFEFGTSSFIPSFGLRYHF